MNSKRLLVLLSPLCIGAPALALQNFGAQQVISTQVDLPLSVYATDLDGDGDADVLSASPVDDKIAWYENQGGGAFGAQQLISTQADGARSVYAADLDEDGDKDVLSALSVEDKVVWYENQGGGVFGAEQVISATAPTASSVYATDLDGDGDADVLSTSWDFGKIENKVSWFENIGTDCNNNGVADSDDIASGHSQDCDQDGVPDECEPDDDGNGVPNDCELNCAEFDRYEDLTPGDTLSLLTGSHNPQHEQGYLCVVAVDTANDPVAFDRLIGNSMTINGFESIEYGINAVDYRAAVAPGAPTDVDGDGILDLNGVEYEKTAGEILIPRFLGQDGKGYTGELVMISLAGGNKFTTTLDFLIYNDNEVAFSAEHQFYCWDRVPLLQISSAFGNDFLAQVIGNDPQESLGGLEAGWMRIDGGVAVSTATSIEDPAFYAVYVERLPGSIGAADLPFERCLQSGHLLPRAVNGDNEEPGTPDQDCDGSIARRRAGSFLLYPEFDNRTGVITVITVTNTDSQESIRAHYTYIGRYGS